VLPHEVKCALRKCIHESGRLQKLPYQSGKKLPHRTLENEIDKFAQPSQPTDPPRWPSNVQTCRYELVDQPLGVHIHSTRTSSTCTTATNPTHHSSCLPGRTRGAAQGGKGIITGRLPDTGLPRATMSVFADGFPTSVQLVPCTAVDPELHSSETHLDTLSSPDYWEKICPGLHATRSTNDSNSNRSCVPESKREAVCAAVPAARKQQLKNSFVQDGFFQVGREEVSGAQPVWHDRIKALAQGVEQLIAHGWPATFIYVFDEAWAVVDDMTALLGTRSFVGCIGAMLCEGVACYSLDASVPS
jgi:hypothetical protein